ncbi:Glutathione S-transferase Mu 1 [Taenia solium]|eukprot:TsM_001229600 transcript=TsM_001229600 gene=TsM_001229600
MSCCESCCSWCCPEKYDLRKAESKAANREDSVFDVEPPVPELEYIDDFVDPPLMLLKPIGSASPLSLHSPSSIPPTPPPTSSPTSPPPSLPLSPSHSSPTIPELEHINDFVGSSLVSLQPTMSTSSSSHQTPPSTPSLSPPSSAPPIQPRTTIVKESELPTLVLSTSSVLTQPRLGYWNIRERAEQIRLFCHYLKEDYEEELYEYGPGPDYSTSEWENKKQSAEFADLELPYWIEEGVRLCGIVPILEHIAEKHDLCELKKVDDKGCKYDMPQAERIRTRLRKTQQDIDKLRGNFEDLCYDKEWINYPDFNLYDLLDALMTFAPDCLKQFENLENFMLRFRVKPAC